MTTANDILKQIKDNDVKFVGPALHRSQGQDAARHDGRRRGRRGHVRRRLMFDGSSIAGWKAINESDMVLMPNTETAHMDPFFAQSTMVIVCDILDPISGESYNRDPRGTAKKAEAYMKAEGVGDTIYVGPEAEFFIFDDVKYKADPLQHRIRSSTRPSCLRMTMPNTKPATWATARASRAATSRSRRSIRARTCVSEMLSVMSEMGVVFEKHHHEVAAASTNSASSSTR